MSTSYYAVGNVHFSLRTFKPSVWVDIYEACILKSKMLSYMLPVEEKHPSEKGRLQLELAEGPVRPPPGAMKSSIISKESSVSSFAGSDVTSSSITPTGQEKPKLKLLTNGNKHTTLKRVSFGSSKGSMVETLIYESPLQEEPEIVSPPPPLDIPFPFPEDILEQEESERSKVRVSFFQSVRAQSVAECEYPLPHDSPPPSAPLAMAAEPDHVVSYNRQESTESGWDNPFRPDGDLSREADEIVSLIRGGKPITPTPNSANTPLLPALDETDSKAANNTGVATPVSQSPIKQSVSRAVEGAAVRNGAREVALDVQRAGPPEPQQPELVLIKKKPKCKCCVIQ